VGYFVLCESFQQLIANEIDEVRRVTAVYLNRCDLQLSILRALVIFVTDRAHGPHRSQYVVTAAFHLVVMLYRGELSVRSRNDRRQRCSFGQTQASQFLSEIRGSGFAKTIDAE